MKGYTQPLAVLSLVSLLAACGTTRSVVVQRPGPSRSSTDATSSRASSVSRAGSYRVEKGDTLYSIAFRHGLDFRNVARWNGISAPYTIWPGQQLTLREPTRGGAVSARAAGSVASAGVSAPKASSSTRPDMSPAPSRPSSAPGHSADVADAVPVAGVPASAPVPQPAPSAPASGETRSVGGVTWRWPASGSLIKGFQGGDAIPGIEIAGAAGSPVRAAADGVVVYSGNGLVGYGELIIVKHNDDFLSAYGHNRKRLVKEGQRVSAGQQIAEMGDTGASRNELQFQIRRNGNPVNPLDYLPAR